MKKKDFSLVICFVLLINVSFSDDYGFSINDEVLENYFFTSSEVIIPEDVKVIGENAFNDCDNL